MTWGDSVTPKIGWLRLPKLRSANKARAECLFGAAKLGLGEPGEISENRAYDHQKGQIENGHDIIGFFAEELTPTSFFSGSLEW